jgi:hypothetical protein
MSRAEALRNADLRRSNISADDKPSLNYEPVCEAGRGGEVATWKFCSPISDGCNGGASVEDGFVKL